MTKKIFYCLFLVSLFSCKADPTGDLVDLDLMSYGVPIKIKAPEGADIQAEDMVVMKDVTIKKDDYYVQLLYSDAMTHDPLVAIAEQKKTVENSPYFSKFIHEEDHGFIFEKKIDDNNINYDFRYIKLRGGKEYLFQTGLIGKFSEDQVRKMFEAVQ